MLLRELSDEPEQPPIWIAIIAFTISAVIGLGLERFVWLIVPISAGGLDGLWRFAILVALTLAMILALTRGEMRRLHRLLVVVAWAFVLALFVV